ncbi:UNVERIFIED_CONTAM: Autophagy-related protein 16 [Sesamum radiatum]|uniref:Autophagy-related protein 16 n=1 Tax=Sesamum radiatum TaxID=300843 RepID=A0AAW2RY83_SESRA
MGLNFLFWVYLIFRSQEDVAMGAIKHALKALRKRHLLEEGAHSPALIALSRPIVSQGSEWKEKAENLEVELQQCYKAQSRLSEQLVVEVAESRTSKALIQEKESMISELQNELSQARDECSRLAVQLEEKTKALELLICEHQDLKGQLEATTLRANNAEAENKMLIDRWMLEKMKDAERLNEANAIYEDMVDRLKGSSIQLLARQQVDGVVRQSEEASSANNLYVWDVSSGRVRHTLTGHVDKVCAVDVSKVSNRNVVSAAYDRTIKVWDLQKGYCVNTLIFHSNCNALCFSMDGQTICSGHVDGNLRLWDIQTGKLLSEVAAHSFAVTSLSLSRNGNVILSSGRDNLHNLFDMRTLEICATLRGNGNRVASNWSRSCISPDDGYVAAGSADGSVHIWSVTNAKVVSTLKEHTSPVLCCSWSNLGKPLATSDKNGNICVWS